MADLRNQISCIDAALTVGAAVAATSITINKCEDIYGNVNTLANFGTKGWIRIDPEGDGIAEDVTFSGITSNSDGTYTLTGIKTVLAKTPYTETSGLVRAHSAGAIVRFSNPAGFYAEFANKYNDETITGTWTFPNGTPPTLDSYAAPTDDAELASKKYVDDVAAGGTASINRVVISGTAGETVAAGNIIYLDESNNEWMLSRADNLNRSINMQLGIAQGAGTNGNAISGGVLIYGRDVNQSGLTAGDRLYISDTPGTISASAGTLEVEIGHAISATQIDFIPNYGSYTTKNQRDAFVGNNGNPSSNDLYVTQTGLQIAAEVYAASITGNDTYVVTLSPVPTAYTEGMTIRFKPDTANTGACTINVNSLGAKSIVKNVSDALPNNTLKANGIYTIIYDGTNFQLVNTPEVLQGGGASNADDYHYHGENDFMLGVRYGTRVKGYWNFSKGFLLSTNVPSGDFWTLVNYTKNAGDETWLNLAVAVGNNTMISSRAIYHNNAAGILIDFSTTKKVIVEFGLSLSNTGTDQGGFGLSEGTAPFIDYDDQSDDAACFTFSTAGALYAHTANTGVGHTETLISGVTLTNHNTYRIEFAPGVDVKFYVNGILKATNTTNLPATNDIYFGYGSVSNTDYPNFLTRPEFAIEK